MNLHFRFSLFDFRWPGLQQPLTASRPTKSGIPHSSIGDQPSKMARHVFFIVIFVCGTLTAHAEDTPHSAMRKGLKAYKAGEYTNAVSLLEKTVLEFPGIGNYNLGNSYYRLGEYEQAEDHYTEALRTTDLELQAQAYFNCGNALLARTTTMTGNEQIGMAIECAFKAMDMYEKAIQLAPDDLPSKQNYERAWQLRLQLEFNLGKWYYDEAESLLPQYKAKDAQSDYRKAKKQFEHILADIDPSNAESRQYLPKVEARLQMLKQAVEDTEQDLETALQYIRDYQYLMAAKQLTVESDARKYAFDIKPGLKKKYEETTQKNSDIWEILQHDNNLNIAQ